MASCSSGPNLLLHLPEIVWQGVWELLSPADRLTLCRVSRQTRESVFGRAPFITRILGGGGLLGDSKLELAGASRRRGGLLSLGLDLPHCRGSRLNRAQQEAAVVECLMALMHGPPAGPMAPAPPAHAAAGSSGAAGSLQHQHSPGPPSAVSTLFLHVSSRFCRLEHESLPSAKQRRAAAQRHEQQAWVLGQQLRRSRAGLRAMKHGAVGMPLIQVSAATTDVHHALHSLMNRHQAPKCNSILTSLLLPNEPCAPHHAGPDHVHGSPPSAAKGRAQPALPVHWLHGYHRTRAFQLCAPTAHRWAWVNKEMHTVLLGGWQRGQVCVGARVGEAGSPS